MSAKLPRCNQATHSSMRTTSPNCWSGTATPRSALPPTWARPLASARPFSSPLALRSPRPATPTSPTSKRSPCEIARSLDSYKVIVEKSTVPVYTNEWIRRSIERNGVAPPPLRCGPPTPSSCARGTAVADFLHPDRIVIGADSERAASLLGAIYAPLTTGAYYAKPDHIAGSCSVASPPPLLNTSTKSAEIIKHASNAFLALKISFINAVLQHCVRPLTRTSSRSHAAWG